MFYSWCEMLITMYSLQSSLEYSCFSGARSSCTSKPGRDLVLISSPVSLLAFVLVSASLYYTRLVSATDPGGVLDISLTTAVLFPYPYYLVSIKTLYFLLRSVLTALRSLRLAVQSSFHSVSIPHSPSSELSSSSPQLSPINSRIVSKHS